MSKLTSDFMWEMVISQWQDFKTIPGEIDGESLMIFSNSEP